MRTALEERDVARITEGAQHYGPSWKRRGGAGAYMVAIRKWDRLVVQLGKHDWHVGAAIAADQRAEGIMDDLRDLRCYFLMILAERQRPVAASSETDLGYVAEVPYVLTKRTAFGETPVSLWMSRMGELEQYMRLAHWNIFDRGIPGLDALLYESVNLLYALDAEYGGTVPDVQKGASSSGRPVTVVYLRGGHTVYLPGHLVPGDLTLPIRSVEDTLVRFPNPDAIEALEWVVATDEDPA